MTSTVNERIKTNKILMDICNFDKSLFDTSTLSYDEIKYYNSITRGFDKQIQFFIDWLDSDEARRIFYENESYNEEVFGEIEDEIKSIVGDTSLTADEIISRIYDSGLEAGADEIRRTKYYNDATKFGLYFLQDYNFELINNVNEDLKNHIRAEIFTGIAAGESMPEVAKRILTATGNSLTGKTLTAKQRAMMIARTETARAMTQGRLQSYANYGVREVKVLTAGDESVCAICREAESKIYPITEAGNLVPFHPLCRCSVMAYIRHGILQRTPDSDAPIINITPSLSESLIPSLFPSDNTPIPELRSPLFKKQCKEFRKFANGKTIEYGGLYTISGVELIFKPGDAHNVDFDYYEFIDALSKGAAIMMHNHPALFNNLHSYKDIYIQVYYGLKYSIVESYTKQYIILNKNNLSTESKNQLLTDIWRIGTDFDEKISYLTNKKISNTPEYAYLSNEDLDKKYDELWEYFAEKNFREYENKISKIFSQKTGLYLYVHDKDKGELF